ncbi:MAG: DUF4173 domain-containing protein [Candidatus Magasanikbacteria bacterium]|nr:DUF4173 domain-containing protein [Candidatus Magasanikbacteria bacterium]
MNFLAKENRFSRFAVQIYSGIALAAAIVFEFVISGHQLGIGAALFFSVLLILYTLFLFISGHIRQRLALIFLVPLVFIFGSFALYTDDISSQFLYPMAVVLSVLFFIILTVHVREPSRFHILSIPVIRKFFTPLFKKLNELSQIIIPASLRKHDLEKSRLVIIGIIISLPLIIFFTALLMSADADFRDVLVSLFRRVSVFVDAHTWLHIFKIIILWLLFSSLFFVITRLDHEVQEKILKVEKFNSTIIGTVVTMINILFASFVIVQFTHLFGSYEYVRVNSIIFSEYARQGFNQLIMVSVSALLVFFVTYRSLVFHGMSRLLRISQAVFLVQVGVIALSAFNRINLYEQAYGYTIKRLLVEWFSVTLMVMVVVMAIAVLLRQSFRNVVYTQAVVLLLAISSLPLMRIEYRVAYNNIERFTTGVSKEIDFEYIQSLSDAVFPALGLLADANVVEKMDTYQVVHIKNILGEFKTKNKDRAFVEQTIHRNKSSVVAMQLELAYKDRFVELEDRREKFLQVLDIAKKANATTICRTLGVRILYTTASEEYDACVRKNSNISDVSVVYSIYEKYGGSYMSDELRVYVQSIGAKKDNPKETETVFIPITTPFELPIYPEEKRIITEPQDMLGNVNIEPELVPYLHTYIMATDGTLYTFDPRNYGYRHYDVKLVYGESYPEKYRPELVLINEQ